MEQIQNEMRANQGKKMALADRRALELEAKHPQLSEYDNQPEPTEGMRGSGGEAGLARVVGSGKKRGRKPKMMVEEMVEEPAMSGGAKMQGKMLAEHLRKLHGEGFLSDFWDGFKSVIKPVANIASILPIPGVNTAGRIASAVLGNGRAGAGKCEMCGYKKCRCSGGMVMKGRPIADQKMVKGAGRAGAGMCGAGNQVAHANANGNRAVIAGQALGGQDLPPNSVAPMTYGNVPQAPASFARNSVGMGRAGAGRAGAGMAGASNGTMDGEGFISNLGIPIVSGLAGLFGLGKQKKARASKATGARSARGAMISKLMKEQGMSLGEASRYIKEHGSA